MRRFAQFAKSGGIALSGFTGMPTDRALPAAIARIDRNQQYGGERRLVRQKCTELREGPRMQNCTLRTPGLNSVLKAAVSRARVS